MPDLNVLKTVLERYGAKKVIIEDIHTPCDIYELDPLKHDKYACTDDIAKAGFEFFNWAGADYLNRLAGKRPLVTPTSELRNLVVDESGGVKIDDSKDADTKIIDAMCKGETVRYRSVEEMNRIHSQLNPMMIVVPLDLEYMLRREREQDYIRNGNAIILANPHSPNTFGLLMEKDRQKLS